MTPQTRISPRFRSTDWAQLRPSLNDNANVEAWARAIEMLHDRIQSRFLQPVDHLKNAPQSTDLGFGFAMLALDCLLIDTIQSFREGRLKGNEARTARAFVDFFRASTRFGSPIWSRRLIDEFFDAIRCGLMHDGETRKGWRLRRRHETAIVERSDEGYVLYRDNFHDALKAEFETYKEELSAGRTPALRENFLIRMDAICDLAVAPPSSIRYFAYGSNMDPEQMRSRAPNARFAGTARLDGYRVVFNKSGTDGSAKANIEMSSREESFVLGGLYEVPESEFITLHGFEIGYLTTGVEVDQNTAKVRAQTFIADATAVVRGSPSPQYLSTILRGAEALGLPEQYVASLPSDGER
jgi:hypothetical protein